jgi:hypothetical protein
LPVLLPGSGKAWIRRDKAKIVTGSEKSALRSSRRTLGVFDTVIFRGTTQKAMRPNLSLLRFFGQVRHLELHDVDYDSRDWLEQVLIDCPMLEELRIVSSSIDTLSPLLDAFKSRRCRLRRLEIDSLQSNYDFWDRVEALCCPQHPFSRQVEEVSIVFSAVNSEDSLARIQEFVRAFRDQSQRETSALSNFTTHLNRQESTHVYRLQLEFKLALLSVARLNRDASGIHALGQLDAEALATIFYLAGHFCRWRFTTAAP